MDKLIRSKHLQAKKSGSSFIIVNEFTGRTIRAEKDLVDLIDKFYKPAPALDFEQKYLTSNYNEVINKLKNIGFLIKEDDDEGSQVIPKWKDTFGKKIHTYISNDQISKIIFFCKDNEPVTCLTKEIALACTELVSELFPLKHHLQVFYLSQKEFFDIVSYYNMPADTKAFVDAKSVLILNYDLFLNETNSDLFYPTIRHEITHILFGQYRFNLPFWLEEGLCELYSKRTETDNINLFLRGKQLISFANLNNRDIYSFIQFEAPEDIKNTFYLQAQSFTDFLIKKVGIQCFWNIINQISICQNFAERLLEEANISLSEIEEQWMSEVNEIEN